MGLDRLDERADLGVPFPNAAFGRVDDSKSLPGVLREADLEGLQVVQHLRVGEDAAAVDVVPFRKVVPVPDDPLPLHRLDGVERVQFGEPDLVDRGAGGVVESVGESEILSDERDGIAAEMSGEGVGEMRDGRRRLETGAPSGERPEKLVELGRRNAADPAGPGFGHRAVHAGVDDEFRVLERSGIESLVEPAGDDVIVQGRHEVRRDPRVEQGPERGLGRHDRASIPDPRSGEHLEIATKARAGAHHHAESAPGDPGEILDSCARRVVVEIRQLVLDRRPALRQHRGHRRPGGGREVDQAAGESTGGGPDPPAARRVFDDPRSDHHQGMGARETRGEPDRIVGVDPEDQTLVRQPAREVEPREHGAEQGRIGLQDHHHPGAAQPPNERLDVITETETDDRDAGVFGEIDLLDQTRRLRGGPTGAGEPAAVPRSGEPTVLGGLDLDLPVLGRPDRSQRHVIHGPQRGQVRLEGVGGLRPERRRIRFDGSVHDRRGLRSSGYACGQAFRSSSP